MSNILIKPLITEKTSADSEKYNRFGFVVTRDANKIEIRKAVEKKYNVKVVSVRTLNMDGKARSRFTKTGIVNGRTKGMKKAFVQLAEGDVIDFYENI